MILVSRILNKLKNRSGSSRHSKNNALHLRFRMNFLIYFFLLMIVPILILGFLFYHQSGEVIRKNIHSLALENMTQESRNLDGYLDELGSFSRSILQENGFLSQMAATVKALNTSADVNASDNKVIINHTPLHLESIGSYPGISLKSIYMLSGNTLIKVYGKDNASVSASNFTSETWYLNAATNPGEVSIVGTGIRFFPDSSYQYVVSTSYYYDYFQDNRPVTFLFDFDMLSLEKLLRSPSDMTDMGSEPYAVDKSNTIMYCMDKGLLTTKLDDKFSPKGLGVSQVTRNGESMYMVYYTSPQNGWKVINFIPAGKMVRGAFFSLPFLILAVILILVAVYLFSLTLSIKLLKPLDALTTAVSDQEKDPFAMNKGTDTSAVPDPDGISNMDKLVHKIYSTQIQQKEAQLKSLQNQINPHFLYNTLESIRGAALYYGAETIAEMSKCLSLFFRYSISDNVLVSIKDELQHLGNYMAIQNFRHEDKFELICHIPERLYDCKILKLTLQPLVENAIKHGLEMKMGKGRITITALSLDQTIRIQIQDNGSGIPDIKLQELQQILNSDAYNTSPMTSTGTGVGVQNVNSRIKIYFGRQYGLKYSSSESGTTVEITIPEVDS